MPKKSLLWLIPILLVIMITPFTPFLDLKISHYFYTSSTETVHGHFTSNAFLKFLYNYGPMPALIVGLGSAFFYLLSFLISSWKKWRTCALYLLLSYALGAGVIVHAALKDNWGRPRPVQTTEFGGIQPFRPYYSPNFTHQPEPSKSFACGHCSTGFYFFALYFLGKRLKSPLVCWGGLAFALCLGISLSVMRIALGGHFFSDTLMSALIMWLTALTLDWLLFPQEQE